MKTTSPELCREIPSRRRKAQVLRVAIFKRKHSRFWQARVVRKGKLVRITTRTQNETAAKEFAELAYRHFARGGERQSAAQLQSSNNLEFNIR